MSFLSSISNTISGSIASFTTQQFPIESSPIVAPTWMPKTLLTTISPLVKPSVLSVTPTWMPKTLLTTISPLVKPSVLSVTPTWMPKTILNSFPALTIPKSYPTPLEYQTPPLVASTPTIKLASPTTKTITFTVVDDRGGLPLPNVYVDGVHNAIGDESGKVTLPNLSIGSMVRVTFIGMKDYEAAANAIPSVVMMQDNPTELEPVVITRAKKLTQPETTKTSPWVWALLGVVVVGGIKSMNSGSKVVKAKI